MEIIKRPGTAIYGSDAVGGVVNAFTRDPSVRPKASAFAEGGGNGYVRTLLTGSSKFGGAGVRADLNLTRSDGWRNDSPYYRQSSTLRWDQAVSAHSSFKTIVAFSHIYQPSDGGSDLTRADYENAPETNYNPITYRRVWAFRASSAWEHRSDLSLLGATGYVRYNELVAATFPVLGASGDSLFVAWSQMGEAAHRAAMAAKADMRDPKAIMRLPRVGQAEIMGRQGAAD